MLVGMLCLKVEKIRTLCGGKGPTMTDLRKWSVFDVASVGAYSPNGIERFRRLHKVIMEEFLGVSFDVFKTVKGMVELFTTGKGSSIPPEQIDRVCRELDDLVELAGPFRPYSFR